MRLGRAAPWRLVLALLLGGCLASPGVQAQSAMDQLNKILGRELSVSEGRRTPAPTRSVSRPAPRPGNPTEAPASPGGIATVDMALLHRLHPGMRLLQIPDGNSRNVFFVRKDEIMPLVPSSTYVEEQQRAAQDKRKLIEELTVQVRAAEARLNDMPRSAAQELNKLPASATAARRKQVERDFHQKRADSQAELLRLQTALEQLREDLAPEVGRRHALVFSRIRRDIVESVRAVSGARGLGVVLNLPRLRERVAPKAVSPVVKPTTVASNQNWLNEFFVAPLRNPLDRHLLGTYLAKWEWTNREFEALFPFEVWQPAVVTGGVDLTPDVLRHVWEKYKVDEARIRAALQFLARELSTSE